MSPAGHTPVQLLRDLDGLAAVLEKMGLPGCPFSEAKREK